MAHSSDTSSTSSLLDPRAVKSGQALRRAFLVLLERKPLDQITVREIAAEAGVHYATFFRHHTTKEALLDQVATDQIDRLVELTLPVLDTRDSEAAFISLCAYVDEHRQLWMALLTGGAAAVMRERLLGIAKGLAAERPQEVDWLPVDLAVICTVSLIVETVAWWLTPPSKGTTVAEVARILHRLVQSSTMPGPPGR